MEHRRFKYFNKEIQSLVRRAKKISLPGFEGIPLYDVIAFFFKGMRQGAISIRSSSIAFHFFLAMIPATIFFFTLVPHIPIQHFREGLLSLIEDMLPQSIYLAMESTLQDLFIKRSGLQWIGFGIALVFATNGINGMIVAFNNTYHTIETRSWFERRLIAASLVFIIFTLITIAISLVVFNRIVLRTLLEMDVIRLDIIYYLLQAGKWIVVLALIFSAISFLYYMAPSKKTRFRFISPGSTLSSILAILTSLIFAWFMNQFGQFNKIFGSLGTLMMIMLFLYFNAMALLIGFELNASIKNAALLKEEPAEDDPLANN